MVSFKHNYNMISIHPESLQKQLRWLILTGNNNITTIPTTIGRCIKLQKLMLSGCTSLTSLPTEIQYCTNLELVRL